ncbi:XRE family transcriptional regulator [Lactobacillus rhamnosus]|uniref:XRE family transcriptional regulator n=1 Tax=Lacticaseibacillus rhamnosus TaxID=47715 RepID=A0A7Y7QGY0_LACRH|nr:XRE family transcriptional regulator [Lacticaseibacillus rhamnosus]NVO88910.1 XRE family transcriptional regulator [Lacticaseibacillus rhamnosus]
MTISQFERIKLQLDRNRAAGIRPASQKDVADFLGVSPVYARDILRGERLGSKGREYLHKALNYIGVKEGD